MNGNEDVFAKGLVPGLEIFGAGVFEIAQLLEILGRRNGLLPRAALQKGEGILVSGLLGALAGSLGPFLEGDLLEIQRHAGVFQGGNTPVNANHGFQLPGPVSNLVGGLVRQSGKLSLKTFNHSRVGAGQDFPGFEVLWIAFQRFQGFDYRLLMLPFFQVESSLLTVAIVVFEIGASGNNK